MSVDSEGFEIDETLDDEPSTLSEILSKLKSKMVSTDSEDSGYLNFFISFGAVGILIALFTVVIYFGITDVNGDPYYWYYLTRTAADPPVIYHFPNTDLYADINIDILLPYYNPDILNLYGTFVVISSGIIAFSLIALYVRFRHPLALITTGLFLFTIAFTLGWLDVLASTPRTTDEFGHIVLLFTSYRTIDQFVQDVAWAVTSNMIAIMALGFTFFHVVTGPRQKLDIRFILIGIYMMFVCLFGILVPHLGFLWNTPDARWINASFVWVIQAQVLALPGFWWLSKVEKFEISSGAMERSD